MVRISEKLSDWDSVKGTESWPTLLLGNGFSINVWNAFEYNSLFETSDLPQAAISLFSELETSNFESVLECLHHARLTAIVLRRSQAEIDGLYEEVRDALFDAVSGVHVRWNNFPQ